MQKITLSTYLLCFFLVRLLCLFMCVFFLLLQDFVTFSCGRYLQNILVFRGSSQCGQRGVTVNSD
jgi:hypothetical protein